MILKCSLNSEWNVYIVVGCHFGNAYVTVNNWDAINAYRFFTM